MNTEQIYTLVNGVNSQAFGQSALTVVDAQGLIALGNVVLSSSTNTEAFLNTLLQRIGRTIMDYRRYRNRLSDMVLDDFEYGAILQKIKVKMPEAVEDPAYDLTDGQSVDPWVIYKPDVVQKLFVSRTPYMFAQTISRHLLKEAFTSAEAMGGFISSVMGEMRNAVEVALENLGHVAIANMIAEGSGSARVINLVTEYNAAASPATPVTAATALFDPAFLAYAVRRINETFDMMQSLTSLFNDGSVERFTPREDMRVKVLSRFQRAAQTVVEYAAFHEDLVSIDNGYETLPFWQSAQTPDAINIEKASDGTATNIANIIAIVHDRDALGIYQIDEEVQTSGLNPRGLYYTTFMHERQLWFNDLSENFVAFTLN